jgi:cell fate regulator YaaT (PSP1 superfamily)
MIEVRFKGNRKEYFTWPGDDALEVGAPVIVEVDRGQDMGVVTALGETAEKKCERCGACADARSVVPPLRTAERGTGGEDRDPQKGRARVSEPAMVTYRVLRRATSEEAGQTEQLRREEEEVRRQVRERAAHHALSMKISDAEWQWDRRKLTVYFTADQRVDFRALVRDLAARYRTRIELRQIGARDEARRLDGIGRCGRQLCISTWLHEPRPVSLSLAKAQNLALNPVQISGPCGRLLCCLHYEHQFYVESRKRFPKQGKTVRTRAGVERVIAVDIFRDRVTLRHEAEGGVRVVPLAQLGQELESVAVEGRGSGGKSGGGGGGGDPDVG